MNSPAVQGGSLALLASALFGVSTPLVQRFGTDVGPFFTAALLYFGAAVVGAILRRPVEREARLVRSDGWRLAAVACFGAAIGPVALAWGLQRTNGTSASLMLTLEAVVTAMLARVAYHEVMDRRVWTAMLLLVAGGALLLFDQGRLEGTHGLGLLAVLEVPAVGPNGAAVRQAGELKQARPLRREAGHLARYRGHAYAETAAHFAADPHTEATSLATARLRAPVLATNT